MSHRGVRIQVPCQVDPLRIIIDSCLLIVHQLVVDEKIIAILREGHEVYTDSKRIGIRMVRFIYRGTLDIMVLDEQILIGCSELLGLVRGPGHEHRYERPLLLQFAIESLLLTFGVVIADGQHIAPS